MSNLTSTLFRGPFTMVYQLLSSRFENGSFNYQKAEKLIEGGEPFGLDRNNIIPCFDPCRTIYGDEFERRRYSEIQSKIKEKALDHVLRSTNLVFDLVQVCFEYLYPGTYD